MTGDTYGKNPRDHYYVSFDKGKGAFIYDVRFLGRQVGQAASDFTT